MVLGVVFSLLGIGMLVALMFNMAILALPLFVAVAAGRFAYDTGAGALGAIAVGLVAGAAALGVGQLVLVMTRSTDRPSGRRDGLHGASGLRRLPSRVRPLAHRRRARRCGSRSSPPSARSPSAWPR